MASCAIFLRSGSRVGCILDFNHTFGFSLAPRSSTIFAIGWRDARASRPSLGCGRGIHDQGGFRKKSAAFMKPLRMGMEMSMSGTSISSQVPTNRWWQLAFGVICMIMVANLQYGWTYFVDPIDAKYHWGRTDIQIAFTI